MSDLTVRPSRQAYDASWPERKGQILRVGGVAGAILLFIVAIEIVRQPSSALLIVLLAALAGFGASSVFALEFAYVRNAVITVTSSGLRLTGVPLRRTRTCSVPVRFDRATVKFSRGLERRAWIAVDKSGRTVFWIYADFWDENSIRQLAGRTGASVSGSWTNVKPKPAAPRW
jgi:hypothetical protein